jgi:hypothetical protein
MVVLLHGEAGGWDELLIALIAFGVMWLAVKLAGRKSATDDDQDELSPDTDTDTKLDIAEEDGAHPPATPRV